MAEEGMTMQRKVDDPGARANSEGVIDKIQSLEKEIENLVTKIGELNQQLSPILLTEQPKDDCGVGIGSNTCHVSSEISGLIARVLSLQAHITDMQQRIDL